MAEFTHYIDKVARGETLDAEEAAEAFDIIMSGEATQAQMGAFVMALRVRGETTEEVTGAVKTMRAKVLAVEAPPEAMDLVGTGGDAKGTYNISTCAAFLVAGAGVPVAKHGTVSISSKSGSADALRALGVKLEVGPETVARAVREAGIGFMFAPAHHAAMRHVAPVRKELATRTIFNILGPLANPAGVKRQMVGVYDARWLRPFAETLKALGSTAAWIVHGSDGMDEITTTGPTKVAALAQGVIREFEIVPEDADIPRARPEDLEGGDGTENAAAIRRVLAGEPGPLTDIALLNAAAALVVAERARDLDEGVAMARKSIASGSARAALEKLIAITNAERD